MRIFSQNLVLVFVTAVLFVSGCNQVVISEENQTTTAPANSEKNTTEVVYVTDDSDSQVDPENYRGLLEFEKDALVKISRSEIEEADDYHNLLWNLGEKIRGIVASNPKLVLVLVNYFGDEYLKFQNKRSLVALKDFVGRAKKAYTVVNSEDFNNAIEIYLKKEQDVYNGNLKWRELLEYEKDLVVNFNGVDEAKAYYRRFSIKYNPCNKIWKKIIDIIDEKVSSAVDKTLSWRDLVVSFEKTDKNYYITDIDEYQRIALIKFDTSYSLESVQISKIKADIYSWQINNSLSNCLIKDTNGNPVSDHFDFEDIVVGIDTDINIEANSVEEYSLECNIYNNFERTTLTLFNAKAYRRFIKNSFYSDYEYSDILKSIHIRGISFDDEFVILKAKNYKKQLEEVADSDEKREVRALLDYFINDGYGGYGDGWLILKKEFYQKYSDGLTGEVLEMDLLDWIKYFEQYEHH